MWSIESYEFLHKPLWLHFLPSVTTNPSLSFMPYIHSFNSISHPQHLSLPGFPTVAEPLLVPLSPEYSGISGPQTSSPAPSADGLRTPSWPCVDDSVYCCNLPRCRWTASRMVDLQMGKSSHGCPYRKDFN